MALWQITTQNKYNFPRTRIIYTKGQLSFSPSKLGKCVKVKRFKYQYKGFLPPGVASFPNKKYIIPGWVEVDPHTTLDDIEWVKKASQTQEKKKIEKFNFESSSSNKTYKVTKITHPNGEIKLTCNCMGFFRSKGNCKHVKKNKK